MRLKGKQILAVAVIILALVLAVVGYIVLPETLVVHKNISGAPGSTLPKLYGLAIPTLISIGGALYFLFNKKSDNNKSILVSLIGIAGFIFTFIFNLKL